jgi:hypothetical protein
MSADESIAGLEKRLAALDRPIRTWIDARERASSGNVDPRKPKLLSRLPTAAAAAAGVGRGPQAEVFAVFDEVCDLYSRSDAQRCALIRGIVQIHEAYRLVVDYCAHCAKMLEQSRRAEWLDRGLAAASIDDQRIDYRAWLVSVGGLYVAARKAAIDPTPAMERMAQRSNPDVHESNGTSTREMLAGFERTAYFGMSILPSLH